MAYGFAWRSYYGMPKRSSLGVRYGLTGLAWYIVWPGRHRMVWPGGPDMGYGMAWRASRGIAWPGGHRMVYFFMA